MPHSEYAGKSYRHSCPAPAGTAPAERLVDAREVPARRADDHLPGQRVVPGVHEVVDVGRRGMRLRAQPGVTPAGLGDQLVALVGAQESDVDGGRLPRVRAEVQALPAGPVV